MLFHLSFPALRWWPSQAVNQSLPGWGASQKQFNPELPYISRDRTLSFIQVQTTNCCKPGHSSSRITQSGCSSQTREKLTGNILKKADLRYLLLVSGQCQGVVLTTGNGHTALSGQCLDQGRSGAGSLVPKTQLTTLGSSPGIQLEAKI